MSLRSRLSIALAASAPFLCAGVAEGQTTSNTVTLYLKNNSEGVVRGESYNSVYTRLNQFNQANCIDNEFVTFNIDIRGSLAATSGYHLEAWIGNACDVVNNRISSTRTCRNIGTVGNSVERMEIWVRDMVGPLTSVSDSGTGGTGGTAGMDAGGTGGTAGIDAGGTGGTSGVGGTDVGVGGTDIGLGGSLGSGGLDSGLSSGGFDSGLGTGGSIPTAGSPALSVINGGTGGDSGTAGTGIKTLAETAGTGDVIDENGLDGPASEDGVQPISVCNTDVNTTPFDRTIYFVLVNNDGNFPGNAATGATAKWAYNYDMAGPSPPVGVSAGVGENALVMKWSQAPDAPIDLKQYVFLCDPPPGGGSATGDTGAAGAGGEGSGDESTGDGTINELCTTAAFHENQVPSHDVIAKNFCGNVQSTTTQGEAGPLSNNVRYAIGIASRDGYYNVGPISNIVCGTPELVKDFFEAYREAGGRGGGGFCAIGKVRTHALTTLFFLGALGLIVRRRTRARGDRRSAS